MELVVIHNPEAGGGEWSAQRVEHLLRDAGHSVQITSAKKKWRDLLRERPDAFVAAGGDGTVHDLVHALAGRDVAIAILPTGTANNVAHALGFRVGDDLAMRVARWQDNEMQLQIPVVESGGKTRSFLESVGVGAFATMMHQSDPNITKSAAAIALVAIRKQLVKKLLAADPVRVTTRIDGALLDGEFVLLECLNLPCYGPRLRLAAHESPDAVAVTVCGVRAEAREQVAQWIATGDGHTDHWVLGRGASVELSTDERAHVDGEIWPSKDPGDGLLRIRAGARAVRVWV
jgi:diacylglycerol kinase family enzyme